MCVERGEPYVLWLDSWGPMSSARPADQPSSIIIAPITLLMMIVIMVMTADSRVFGTQERKRRKTGGRKPGSAQMFHTKRKKVQLRWLLEDTVKIVPLCQDWPPMNEESVPVEQVIEAWVWDYRLCVCVCSRAQITSELLRVHPGGGFCSCFYISREI